MNYLGHAYLSFDRERGEILTGNMIGDHVKGMLALEAYSPGIRKGLLLHRKIDEFADNHPATKRAKLFFRTDYGLYSGAIMDTLYDHFLANDPKIFNTEADLLAFSKETYQLLHKYTDVFPPKFAMYFPYMEEDNWLYGYRTLKRMERALQGLARRAVYMPPPEKAFTLFVSHFYELNQCYLELIGDMTTFVKNELNF